MRRDEPLYLHEELMLLALKDEAGTIVAGAMYQYAVAGALLAELLMRGRLGIDSSGRKPRVAVLSERPIGEPLLDECLQRVAQAKRPGTAQHWVSKFAQTRQIKHRVAGQLVERGILRADQDKVLLVFSRRIYPELDPRPERAITARVRDAVFGERRDLDARTVVLTSLADGAGILRAVFDKRRLKGRKARLEQLRNGEVAAEATKAAIQAMQAALVVTTVIPVVVSSH